MYLETSIAPPKSSDDIERFEESIRTAQAAGATLARTVILPGRRYETFKSLEEFRKATLDVEMEEVATFANALVQNKVNEALPLINEVIGGLMAELRFLVTQRGSHQ
jgi:hypothetical protein